MRTYTTTPVADRFWSHVDQSGECWNWTGKIGNRGYGHLKVDNRVIDAHRVAMMLHLGAMPTQYVLHRCDNRACVRLSHLFLGTHADNMRDMREKGRSRNGSQVLQPAQVIEIRTRRRNGEKQSSIAKDFGVSASLISLIEHGKCWARLGSA